MEVVQLPGHRRLIAIWMEDDQQKELPLQGIVTIGTAPSNQVVARGEGVEERHCRLENLNGRVILRDLRTPTGTFLNRKQILEAKVSSGDEIQIGDCVFRIFTEEDLNESVGAKLSSQNLEWNEVLKKLPEMARTIHPVLLLGSSGTGKERLARALHDQSHRRFGPFVTVNCSALSESLIESELFGHVKGSFTGATGDRKGAFDSARGGTLFLDEIGDFPLALQPKLLRALENQEIRPVGSDKTIKTNVRIVAATHQSLTEKVARGDFRHDLYFRLHVLKLQIPDLSKRWEDFDSLLFEFARENRVRFSPTMVQELKKHHWPGNVRELKNCVFRAAALFKGAEIQPEHIHHLIDIFQMNGLATSTFGRESGNVIKEIERELIVKRLVVNRGNQRRTAQDLGIPKSTLHDRIRTYGIDLTQFQDKSAC